MTTTVSIVCGLIISAATTAAAQVDRTLTPIESFAGARRAEGIVFWDENANARRDPGEQGVPGVRVTALHQFGISDANGRFSVASEQPFLALSMSWPSGTWPTGSWFELLRQPVQRDIAFGLRREDQKLPLVFVQFTDPHSFVLEACKIIPQECGRHGLAPKFYVATGDFIDQYARLENMPEARRLFAKIRQALDEAEAPLFMVPGNHDVFMMRGGATHGPIRPEAARHPMFGLKAWEKYICPKYWSFTCANVHVIGLEWGEVFQGNMVRYSPAMRGWMESELSLQPPDSRLIVNCHDPVWVPSQQRFMDFGQDLMLFGHSHIEGPMMGNRTMLSAGDCRATTGQLHDGRPHGYRIVVVEEDRFDTFYKGLGEDRAIILNTPRKHATIRDTETFTVRAQAFDPRGRIRHIGVSIGGQRLEVTRTRRRYWSDVEATVTTADLAAGFHDLVVKATWPDGVWALTQPCLVFTERQAPFTAAGPAVLTGTIFGLDRPYKLRFNGTVIGSVEPGGNRSDPFSFEIPATLLRRLNTVYLPGAKGRLKLWGVTVNYEGKRFVDHRQTWDRMWQSEDLHRIVYVDLTRPHWETWKVKTVR